MIQLATIHHSAKGRMRGATAALARVMQQISMKPRPSSQPTRMLKCGYIASMYARSPFGPASGNISGELEDLYNPLVFSNQLTSRWESLHLDMQNRDAKSSLAQSLGHPVTLSVGHLSLRLQPLPMHMTLDTEANPCGTAIQRSLNGLTLYRQRYACWIPAGNPASCDRQDLLLA